MQTIHIVKRNNFGTECLYIADKATAELVSYLTHKKTVNELDIRALRALGLTVTVQD